MKPKVACEWLHACSGCEIALLNTGSWLLELLDRVELVHFPLLMDHKHRQPASGNEEMALPSADIGLVSGGVAHGEHLQVLLAMRRQCRILISFGTCATHGGIPAMMNQWPMAEGLKTVFATTENGAIPTEVPPMLDRIYSLDEKVAVDVSLPGCPPEPALIIALIESLLDRQERRLPQKSVCETCPTIREGVPVAKTIRRFTTSPAYEPARPINAMRCLLEQGFLCMGPVTAGGCAGKDTPLCLRARVPCRGCYGPVRQGGNPLLDMMNALASQGADHRTVVDRRSLLRFCGAHGLLRVLRNRQ